MAVVVMDIRVVMAMEMMGTGRDDSAGGERGRSGLDRYGPTKQQAVAQYASVKSTG